MRIFSLIAQLNCLQGSLGRNFAGQRYGPRPLDLDIIFYGNQTLDHDRLCIPHPRWQERPFVKAPLLDLINKHEVPMGQAWQGLHESIADVRQQDTMQQGDIRLAVSV